MFLRAIIINHSMKTQDVRRLQKTIIENSISSIWRSGCRSSKRVQEKNNHKKCQSITHKINIQASTNNHSNEFEDCNVNKNCNNSSISCYPCMNDSLSSIIEASCTCQNCEYCDCNCGKSLVTHDEKDDQHDDDEEVSASRGSSVKNSKDDRSSRYKEKEDISCNTSDSAKCTTESSDHQNLNIKSSKSEKNFKKFKTKKLKATVYFFTHIFLYLVIVLLKVLCYVKYFFVYIANLKSKRLRNLFVFLFTAVAVCKLSKIIDDEYFCKLSNSVSRILYSKNDALAKIMHSEGKSFKKSMFLKLIVKNFPSRYFV